MTTNRDFNGRPYIAKGTLVRVTTNNGGMISARLAENHYRTYDVVIATGPHGQFATVIPAYRITSVEAYG